MKNQLRKFVAAAAFASMVLAGCAQKIQQPYQFGDRPLTYEGVPSEEAMAVPFADSLCVVTEEDAFSTEEISSEAAAVFGVSDKSVIFSKNAFEELYPASMTKVMTALLAIKYGNLTDQVTVADEVIITEAGATMCGLKPGDTMTMEQLLYGLLLPSGNDAASAIAVHMDGSIEKFSERMNKEAKALGATHTHFMNPHGLHDEQHYTTPYDLYLIFHEALQYPEFRKIVGTPTYTAQYTDASGAQTSKTWVDSNRYLTGDYKAPEGLTVLGGKTGTTQAAGYNLIMGSKDSRGKEYISIVMKAESRDALYQNMTGIIQRIVE